MGLLIFLNILNPMSFDSSMDFEVLEGLSSSGRPVGFISTTSGTYAHIEVVVTFLVVNFFGCSKITRYHGGFEGRH